MTITSKVQGTHGTIQGIDRTPESELSDDALDQVSGGLKASSQTGRGVKVSGPGTQTEDDVYVG